jgi:anaerobic magnesium-protoporphyrin IX monomethyl ester cyclase
MSYMNDVILINPPYKGIEDDALEENLGLSYIAGYLQTKGIRVGINEMTGKWPLYRLLNELDDALVYGISYYSTATESVAKIVDYIRSNKQKSLIYLGGPHPTALPHATLKATQVDGVVVGEGEQSFYEIVCSAKSGKPIRGVIKGRIIQNLDDIPFPVRMMNRKHFTRRLNNEPCISLLSSRGCPYRCLHCNSLIMGGGNPDIRFRSVNNVIEEVRQVKLVGYTKIKFNDDNFTANPDLEALLLALEKENIEFRVFGRIEHLTEPVCQLLKQAGCSMFSIGIESYNPDNLRFLRKAAMLKYFANLKIARSYGIVIRASFMVGLPFDTDETIPRYFSKAAEELDFDEFAIYGLIPYPGTALYDDSSRYHYEITTYDYSKYMQIGKGGESCFVLRYKDEQNSFDPDDVRRWYHQANKILESRKIHMRNSSVT